MDRTSHKGPFLFGLGLAATLLIALAAGGWGVFGLSIASAAQSQLGAARVSALTPLPVTTISGNLGATRALQIDDYDNDPATTPDANLTTTNTGSQTTDTNCSSTVIANEHDSNCPFISGRTYVDWNTVPGASTAFADGKYVLIDPSGSADNSFAGTNTSSCLQPDHSAPNKEDLLRIYLANNDQFLYFAAVDESPNGDSRHVFLLHKNPVLEDLTTTCAGNGHQISVNLDPGDHLILAVFRPSAATPAAQVYNLVGDPSTLLMDDAVDFLNTGLWTPGSPAANFAVNLSNIASDVLGTSTGTTDNNPPLHDTFGEGAIALSDLGISACGGTYNVSVVTRSSGSGSGQSKDFLGGAYNFGGVTASASLAPTCGLDITYSGSAIDSLGNTITADSAYEWKIYKCDTLVTCDTVNADGTRTAVGALDSQDGSTISGDKSSPPPFTTSGQGKYYAILKVTDPSSETCTDLAGTNVVVVYSPLAISPSMAGSCDATGSWTFAANASGGTGAQACSWTFTDTNITRDISPTSSSLDAGSGTTTRGNAQPDTLNGSVSCTETGRADALTCSQSGTASTTVLAPLQVSIAPTAPAPVCPMSSDAVTYAATVSGGDGNYSYAWNGVPCAGTQCLVDPSDSAFCVAISFNLTVDDGSFCALKTSETETYTKTTTVTATNNP